MVEKSLLAKFEKRVGIRAKNIIRLKSSVSLFDLTIDSTF